MAVAKEPEKPLLTETIEGLAPASVSPINRGYGIGNPPLDGFTGKDERSSEKTTVSDHLPPETPTQAARALIAWFAGALAFESVHEFAEAASYGTAFAYGLGAVVVAVADYNLKALLVGSPRLTKSLNRVASDARWWVGAAMVSLLIISISPYVEQRRWPFARQFSAPSSPTVIHDPPTADDIAKATAPIRVERDTAIKERDAAKKELQDAKKEALPTLSPLGTLTTPLSTNSPPGLFNSPPLTASPSLGTIPVLPTEKERQLQAELDAKTKELEQTKNSKPTYRQASQAYASSWPISA
jgi:hypothetical protein